MLTRNDFVDGFTKLAGQCQKDMPKEWWHDGRTTGGLRLAPEAYQYLVQDIKLDNYVFVIDAALLTPKNILSLSRFMTCPYFLQRRGKSAELSLFGSKEAVLVNLYQDVEKFLAALKPDG
jgi:hypothetical protein